jgi:hypothetical protein
VAGNGAAAAGGNPNEHRKSKFVKKIPADVLRQRAASQKRPEKQYENAGAPGQ